MINYFSDSLSALLLILGGFALLTASTCPELGVLFLLSGVIKLALATWNITFIDLAVVLRTGAQRTFA